MHNQINEILNKIKNREISLEEGKQEIQLLKNMSTYQTCVFQKKIVATTLESYDMTGECILLLSDNEAVQDKIYSKLQKVVEDINSTIVIPIMNQSQLSLSLNNIGMDYTKEDHYEQLEAYLKENFSGKRLHIVSVATSSDEVARKELEETGTNLLVTQLLFFAKQFAYSFSKEGVIMQIFSQSQDDIVSCSEEALVAMGKSINREVNSFVTQVTLLEANEDPDHRNQRIIEEIQGKIQYPVIFYEEGIRSTYEMVETSIQTSDYVSFPTGVYVIFGGLGGIGRTIVDCLVKDSNHRIVIAGRRTCTDEMKEQMKAMGTDQGQIHYISCDMSKEDDIRALLNQVVEQFGAVDYLIHSAGVLEDSNIVNKTLESFQRVAASKVIGGIMLSKVLADYQYKKMIFCSSTSGAFGNAGQVDYSYSNQFIDRLCCIKGLASNFCSINWPLWDLHGMNMSEMNREFIYREYGMVPLPKMIGMKYLSQMITSNETNEVILFGVQDQLRNFVRRSENEANNLFYDRNCTLNQGMGQPKSTNTNTKELVTKFLTSTIEEVVGLSAGELKAKKKLQSIGMDSVMISEINLKLEEIFGELPKTLLFEYKTTDELADYFVSHYEDIVLKHWATAEEETSVQANDVLEKVKKYVADVICKVTGYQTGALSYTRKFKDIGIDSIMIEEITGEFNQKFYDTPKTLLFEYNCVSELADYLMKAYPKEIKEQFQQESTPIIEQKTRFVQEPVKDMVTMEENFKGDIAVIGIAGQYPMADSLDEFWKNLLNGVDCITEIPKERWDYHNYTLAEGEPEDKKEWWRSHYKWGGFLNDIDKFDPLSFNIAPNDAKMMDPHQRMYAQTVWHTFEDAGYNRQRLSNYKVGVYTGAMWSNYQLYGIDDAYKGRMTCYDSSLCSISNRISYLFDLHGPSMTLDTMCSSSLVAIHLACQAIKNGEIQMAVAGGVNLTLHPYKYIQLTKGQFLAKDGRCRAFGEGGSGYVPGEGCGAVILKSLDDAKRDHDKIYCVIKASSVKHNGKGIGYNVPDPLMQAEVIEEAIKMSKVDPKTISYIEAHGTGTAVGDPIEIAGLKKAFEHFGQNKFCAIGSVKSNIGHLEAAAGMASLTKVILQMKHRMLVPSIHTRKLNPSLQLDDSPFVIQQELTPWEPKSDRLRAGISAFGAGGTNAHIVVEEYQEKQNQMALVSSKSKDYIFVLSGNDKEILKDHVNNVLHYLQNQSGSYENDFVRRLAYTSQLTRNHMKERLAILYSNLDDLQEKLMRFVQEESSSIDILNGFVNHTQMDRQTITVDSNRILDKNYLHELAKEWVEGSIVTWDVLYKNQQLRKVDLPFYPFAKDSYWLPLGESEIYQHTSSNGRMEHGFYEESIEIYKPYWKEEAIKLTGRVPIGQIVVLADESMRESLHSIKTIFGCNEVYFGITNRTKTDDGYQGINLYAEDGCEALITQLEGQQVLPDVVLDFTDLIVDNTYNIVTPHGKLNFMKWLIRKNRSKECRVIQCTKGIYSGDTLNGAIFAGLMHNITGEYTNINCRQIDFQQQDQMEYIIDVLEHELFDLDLNRTVLYEEKHRKVQAYGNRVFVHNENKVNAIDTEKAYVITGGTRGIGAQVALYLSHAGVKRIALVGRTPMDTPKKMELLEKLKENHTDVLVYTGGFEDSKGFQQFLQQVEEQFGSIHTLFHCAGCYSKENPAFVYKTEEEIDRVLEPKVIGTQCIMDAFDVVDIGQVVLFSSISSISPLLSKGLSDYTMANGYLNMSVKYIEKKYQKHIISIVWPSWNGVGFDAKESQQYMDWGMKSFQVNDGMETLFSLIDSKETGIFIPMKHDTTFHIDCLQKIEKKEVREKHQDEMKPTVSEHTLHENNHVVESKLRKILSDVLGVEEEKLILDEPFASYGMDSIYLTEVIKQLEESLQISIDPVLFFEADNIQDVSARLASMVTIEQPEVQLKSTEFMHSSMQMNRPVTGRKFAIIGMSCRFPEADNLQQFWNNLVEGRDSIKEIPKERFDVSPYYSTKQEKGKTVGKWAGLLNDIKHFDANYFHISDEEATYLDPIIRLSLENSVNAIYHAGYTEQEIKGKNVGVFMGTRVGEFSKLFPKDEYGKISGVGQNFCAAYISHFLDLKGPSMVLDSACSSALVSLSEACKNIVLGECDMALVGGVDVIVTEKTLLMLSSALSPDGKSHTFDESANGFVPGEGCGVVLVKELNKALEDGDQIFAVIDGIAVNNDGNTMGITTPSFNGQMEVIEKAINKAGVNPEEISYIEAHGTGTLIGDPIELKALTKVYRKFTKKTQYCSIGSVKTNIGHLLSAAGIASLIKVVLCIQNKRIPKTLNCNTPNPRFKFAESPFYPAENCNNWDGIDGKYISGLSSFGFGGTNVHVILSEYASRYQATRVSLQAPTYNRSYYWPQPKYQDEVMDEIAATEEQKTNMFGFVRIQ